VSITASSIVHAMTDDRPAMLGCPKPAAIAPAQSIAWPQQNVRQEVAFILLPILVSMLEGYGPPTIGENRSFTASMGRAVLLTARGA
jgi:hypothetical protein